MSSEDGDPLERIPGCSERLQNSREEAEGDRVVDGSRAALQHRNRHDQCTPLATSAVDARKRTEGKTLLLASRARDAWPVLIEGHHVGALVSKAATGRCKRGVREEASQRQLYFACYISGRREEARHCLPVKRKGRVASADRGSAARVPSPSVARSPERRQA